MRTSAEVLGKLSLSRWKVQATPILFLVYGSKLFSKMFLCKAESICTSALIRKLVPAEVQASTPGLLTPGHYFHQTFHLDGDTCLRCGLRVLFGCLMYLISSLPKRLKFDSSENATFCRPSEVQYRCSEAKLSRTFRFLQIFGSSVFCPDAVQTRGVYLVTVPARKALKLGCGEFYVSNKG